MATQNAAGSPLLTFLASQSSTSSTFAELLAVRELLRMKMAGTDERSKGESKRGRQRKQQKSKNEGPDSDSEQISVDGS